MDQSCYDALSLNVYKESMIWHPFQFTHEPLKDNEILNNLFNICGHIHPGIRLKGKARQSLILPCFYFSMHQAILPAYGKFTGNHRILPRTGDKVFVLVDQSVIEL